jgi:hypothetical protein
LFVSKANKSTNCIENIAKELICSTISSKCENLNKKIKFKNQIKNKKIKINI